MKNSMISLFALATFAAPASAAVHVDCQSTAATVTPSVQAFLIRATVESATELSAVEVDLRDRSGEVTEYSRLKRTIRADDAVLFIQARAYRTFNTTEWEDEVYLILPVGVVRASGKTVRAYVSYKSPDDESLRRLALRCSVK